MLKRLDAGKSTKKLAKVFCASNLMVRNRNRNTILSSLSSTEQDYRYPDNLRNLLIQNIKHFLYQLLEWDYIPNIHP